MLIRPLLDGCGELHFGLLINIIEILIMQSWITDYLKLWCSEPEYPDIFVQCWCLWIDVLAAVFRHFLISSR